MRKLFEVIIDNLKKNKNIVVFSVAIIILGFILGVVLSIGEDLECLYRDHLSNYLIKVFSKECSPFKLLFERLFNCFLILLLVAVLSLNKYTFYLNFILLFYRAFILGLAGKIFISGALVSGFLTFVFLIFIQATFLCLSIIVFLALIYGKHDCNFKKFVIISIKILLISLLIAEIGAVLEFIFIVFMFRPISAYF